MSRQRLRLLLAVVAGLGLLCTVVPLARRVAAEQANRRVELAPDAPAFVAAGLGYAALRRAGATAVLLPEETVGVLEAEGLVTLRPVPAGTLVLAPPVVASWLGPRLGAWPVVPERIGPLRSREIGFWRGDLAAVAAAGLAIDARVVDARALTDLRGFPVHAAWFAGDLAAVPPGAAADLHVPLGVVEGPQQQGNVPAPGLRALFRAAGGRAVRVFDPGPAVYAHNTPRDTELQALRAVVSRNVRVIVLHPAVKTNAAGDAAMIAATVARLHGHGFPLGRPATLPPMRVPFWATAGMAVAIAAAALLLADLLGAGGWAWLAAAFALAEPALAASLAFPGLALYLLAKRFPPPGTAAAARVPAARGLVAGVGGTLLAAGLSVVAGIYVGALMASQSDLMEWTLFRGVKVLLVGTPALAAAAAWAAGLWDPPGRLLQRRVRTWHLLLLLVTLVATGVYVARSGDFGSHLAPPAELSMRDWLEVHLAVRPREKEFLIGWPAMVLAGFALARRHRVWYGALLVVGAAATASVADTFAHAHAAFLVSVERTVEGLAVGLIGGVAAYAVTWAVAAWLHAARARGAPGSS